MENKLTIEQAISICKEIEEMIKPIGYHCGLTGSTLYTGESTKDIDIIIYPHQVSQQLSLNQILEAIEEFKTQMYPSQGVNKVKDIFPSTTDKLVVVGEYKGIRIDLFFLQ